MDHAIDVEGLAEQTIPATIAILHRQYPNILLHHLAGEADVRSPQALHPAFFGCYDWHSSVHSHWQVARALRLFPNAPFTDDAKAALDRSLTPSNIEAELAYVADRPSFEMPYGMAWLLQLAAELHEWSSPMAQNWRQALAPLERFAADCLCRYMSRLPYPIRSGLHNQTAFAMGLALDWARVVGAQGTAAKLTGRARDFFLADRAAPLAYEPSGVDFVSPALAEADLMRRVLPPDVYPSWLTDFLGSDASGLAERLVPATVVDHGDGQLAHFAGLNMSRAWMLQGMASALPGEDERIDLFDELAVRHLEAGLESALDGDYMVAHWAPTFVLYLLTERGIR